MKSLLKQKEKEEEGGEERSWLNVALKYKIVAIWSFTEHIWIMDPNSIKRDIPELKRRLTWEQDLYLFSSLLHAQFLGESLAREITLEIFVR